MESRRQPAASSPNPKRSSVISETAWPRLCAHRGLSLACPENTLPAFSAAMVSGVHELELDIWTSADGVPVICHDETVDRTTNGQGRINEMSWGTIKTLDAGIYLGAVWAGTPMPRFEELLEIIDNRVGLNIHMKDIGPDGATLKRICDLLSQHCLVETAYLGLETESALEIAYHYAPEISRACLVNQSKPAECLAIAQRWECQRVQFFRDITEDWIREAHAHNILCNLFYADEYEEAMHYVSMGIDVVLTNCAHTLIARGFNRLHRA